MLGSFIGSWKMHQRQATTNAGAIIGVNVLRSTTNRLQHPSHTVLTRREWASVTSSSTVWEEALSMSPPLATGNSIHEVKDAGDTHLGGKDFENRIVDVCSQDFKRRTSAKKCGGSRI